MTDKHPLDDDRPPWLAQVRAELDASARDLDAATLSRLNRARQAALETGRARRYALRWPAALAAALSLVVAVGWWNATLQGPAVSAYAPADDFELLAGEDNLELYEDLEFYAWLDAQQSSEG